MLTAPFAIALDAITFVVSALMLRRVVARNDVPNPSARAVGSYRRQQAVSSHYSDRP
jgi:hypothetical protein